MRQLTYHEVKNVNHSLSVELVLDHPDSIANVAMIIRSSEAFGIKIIHLIAPNFNINSSRMKTVSRSSFKKLSSKIWDTPEEFLLYAKNSKKPLWALEYTNCSKSIDNIPISSQDCFLVVGSESVGVSSCLLNQCDLAFHIPMFGKQSSINVASASSIALYALSNKWLGSH